MDKSNLEYLEDKLKEKINLLNNYKIKIFLNNNNILCMEENTQFYKNLKKRFSSLKTFSGPLFLEKTSDFILFSNHGDIIILIENNEIFSINSRYCFNPRSSENHSLSYKMFKEENPLFGKKKYIFSLDDNKSVYVTKESFDILKSLLPELENYLLKGYDVELGKLKEEKRLVN
jgi:hypothetical protein